MPGVASFIIRAILPTDPVNGFKTGKKEFLPLKTFLQRDAKDFHLKNIARTYVAVESSVDEAGQETECDPARVLGYVTLTCSEVCLKDAYDLIDVQAANKYDHLPAVKIARLAVDSRQQRKGIGRGLVDLSISVAQDAIRPLIGCRFVITDAKKDAIAFYDKAGFTLLDTPENLADQAPVMFIDLQHL